MKNKSKIWLVTGSASGLGRNIAEAVLASGDRLVATARDPRRLDDLVKKYGDQIRTAPLDVADEKAAQASVRMAVEAFGRLDVVVNNAGYGDIAPFRAVEFRKIQGADGHKFLWRRQRDPRCAANHAQAKERLHPANFVSGWPFGPSRKHWLPCGQVGGRRIHRVTGAGSRSFRRKDVRPRTRRNADELAAFARIKKHQFCCRNMNHP